MAFELFDYQQSLVNRARKAFIEGYQAPCIVSPCGSGKSVVIAEIVRLTTMNHKRVLFLVHRRELVQQIEQTLLDNQVDMEYVTLGMVMTVVRRLETYPPFDLIVIDENHHTLAKSYRKIIDHFHTKVLGFTATPVRLNGDGLGEVNDTLILGPTPKWLIEHQRLAPYEYYSINLSDNSKLKKNSTGDYTNDSMDDSFKKTIFGDVVGHYQKLANGQKTILYAHSIAFSKMFTQQFNDAGITAAHVDGTTASTERQRIMDDFRDGRITVLCNVDLIGEGFDVPDCTAVILARPTASLSLYIQQSMRAMRYRPDKTATIIDHVANVTIHGLPDMEREWSLAKKPRRKQEVEPYPIWTCYLEHGGCGMVFPKESVMMERFEDYKIEICPDCLMEHKIDIVASIKEIKKDVELVRIDDNTAFYAKRNWKKAKSYQELSEIGKAKGYKPSWAAFKAHELGLPDTPKWVEKWTGSHPTKESFQLKLNF